MTEDSVIQSRLEKWQHYISKAYEQYQYYNMMIKDTFSELWQYDQFRMAVYIFGTLSFVPLLLFLVFMSVVILFATVLSVFIWSLITFTLLSFSCIFLLPILVGLFIITSLLIAAHHLIKSTTEIKIT